MGRRYHSKKFKIEAVKYWKNSDKSRNEISKDLGISHSLLNRWIRDYEKFKDDAFPGNGKLKPHEEEIRKLKKKLDELTQERDVLKKVVAIFSK